MLTFNDFVLFIGAYVFANVVLMSIASIVEDYRKRKFVEFMEKMNGNEKN